MSAVVGLDLSLLTTTGYALLLLAGAYGLGRWGQRARASFLPPESDTDTLAPDSRRRAPWPHAETARFYCAMALLLVVLAAGWPAAVLGRRHQPLDLLVIALVLLVAARMALWLVYVLRSDR
ncbi:MAG: hypothetical protein IRZ14_09585 [Chloroflexi bacterium]|nr:hypothetical protein [Chloroflexota bacterium]